MLEPALIAAARDLIRADSVTDHGNLAAVRVLKALWDDAGFATSVLPASDTADRDGNLLAGPAGGGSGDPVLLVTHLDTVSPGPLDRWKTNPFELTIDGNRAVGLGVADVKLDALCKLWAARRLKEAKLSRPFYFLGTFGEEAGLRGARDFMRSPPFRLAAVLCGEPSELVLCHAHKGYAVVRVRVRSPKGTSFAASPASLVVWEGKAAHSSTPQLGVNAIDLALDALSVAGVPYTMAVNGGASANTVPARCEAAVYTRPSCGPALWKPVDGPLPAQESWANVTTMLPAILRLRDLWKKRVAGLAPSVDDRFNPAGAVASLTRIRTEKDAVELTLDARLLPAHDAEGFISAYRVEAEGMESDGFDVTVESDRCANGMSLSESHPLLKDCGDALQSVGLSPVPKAKPTSTEAGVFARQGIPALVFGPSTSTGNAHTANEWANLEQVEKAIDAYEAILRRLCGVE